VRLKIDAAARDAVRGQIRGAFGEVPAAPEAKGMLLPRYASSEDAEEMAAAFAGRRWTDLAIEELFYHREMLGTLNASAYQAYVAAYLEACLATDDPYDKYGADLRHYLLSTLMAWPYQREPAPAETRERLSSLTQPQRDAVAALLRYLVTYWESQDAAQVLASW